ncbi:MAG: hypothetical protein JSW45_09365 [Thiotrichales bacterium]|nr:MAG: hypothetical protein JSW45_09365 [Thiotrichales bacterium]
MPESAFTTFVSTWIHRGLLVITVIAIAACATNSPDTTGPSRAELDAMSDTAIATLVETTPELEELLNQSPGYAVVKMTITKIPVVGTGAGYGVVVNQRTNTRSYIRVSQFEIGGGMGAEKFKVLIVFTDEKLVDRAARGTWHYEAGAEAVAGSDAAQASTATLDKGKGYKAFKITEGGVCVRVTVRVAQAKPYLAD